MSARKEDVMDFLIMGTGIIICVNTIASVVIGEYSKSEIAIGVVWFLLALSTVYSRWFKKEE